MSIPEPTQWNGDDTRDLGRGSSDPTAGFWEGFRFAWRQGSADVETYLASAAKVPALRALVAQARRRIALDQERRSA